MFDEEIKKAVQDLFTVSALLTKIKHKLADYEKSGIIGIPTQEYLDLILKKERRSVRNVVLKRNSEKNAKRQLFTLQEVNELPYLKDLKYRVTQDGIHQFRYRRDGFNVSFNSKNYEVAKKKAYDFIKSIRSKIRSEADLIKGKTLDDVFDMWFDIKKAHLDEKTAEVYASAYRCHIKAVLGRRTIKSILPLDLQPFFDRLFEVSSRKTEDVKTILNGCFNFAIANRMIPSNPMLGVILEKHIRKKGKALNDEELARFKSAMLADDSRFGLAGLIILYTGIRGAELESLSFDWEGGTFTVANAKLKRSQKVKEDNLFRTVPIFPALWGLKERIESEEWKICAGTLTGKFKDHFIGCTVKDLRHTFISRAREAGNENELVNLWTGHLPGKNMAANIYTHYSFAFQKKEAEKLKPY